MSSQQIYSFEPQPRPVLRLVVNTEAPAFDSAPDIQPSIIPEEVANENARSLPSDRILTEAEIGVIGLARQRMLNPKLSPTERTQAVNEYWASYPAGFGASLYQRDLTTLNIDK